MKHSIKNTIILILCIITSVCYAQSIPKALPGLDGFGQIIKIEANLHSFVGKPIWTFIIRDIDNGQTMPYVFDFTKGNQLWMVFTYSRNYLILASRLQIETYQSRYNKYKNYRIRNFCNLESNGRIIRGKSMMIRIEGDLSPYNNTYRCHISAYQDDTAAYR